MISIDKKYDFVLKKYQHQEELKNDLHWSGHYASSTANKYI
ncbi:hypothetical protein B6N60_00232 [Richelia sinica FACHB-800]|uniref:Uncharacterized protein n=1 Tax=Richelia sinica FACHB-800 TaxID=1357546 RepID=A0A975Y2Y2_9NOST|nr:hypothetical protein B6N60_00232 [Richelia sinica FACHB-800]